MGNAIQNRGGRPVKMLSPDDWNLIAQCAAIGMSQDVTAKRLGMELHTLVATEGFTQLWATKKAEGTRRRLARLDDAATGESKPTMPQAVSLMYAPKALEGLYDRPATTAPQATPQIVNVEIRVIAPGAPRMIEGSVGELPPGEPEQP